MPVSMSNLSATWANTQNTYTAIGFNVINDGFAADSALLRLKVDNVEKFVVYANGTISGVETAWSTYTPTITSSVGSFSSVSGAGRYKTIGKTFMFGVTITVTTVGSASGNIVVPLPDGVTAISATAQGVNGINLSTGGMSGTTIAPNGTVAQIGVGTISNQTYFCGGTIEIQ